MKKLFRAYYRPSDVELKELWETATIVLDANVLLDVYGYSAATRESLLAALRAFRERLWVPFQFALDFHNNRVGKILEQASACRDAERDLRKVLAQFRSKRKHPFVAPEVEQQLERICNELVEGAASHERVLSSDPYVDTLTELLEGRVGNAPDAEWLKREYAAGAERFERSFPPGYLDAKKPAPERYGDYLGWKQILEYATAQSASVVFVTDETKEDWWFVQAGKTLGPRRELVQEFIKSSSNSFVMCSVEGMLEVAQAAGTKVSAEAIAEVRERREAQIAATELKPAAPFGAGEGKPMIAVASETLKSSARADADEASLKPPPRDED
ncbi:MAG TPA: PIN-like domain-containing protein [Anaeromyxobacter sp.]